MAFKLGALKLKKLRHHLILPENNSAVSHYSIEHDDERIVVE